MSANTKLDTNVNQFPTLTYNWLKINRTHLSATVNGGCKSNLDGNTPDAQNMPSGITRTTNNVTQEAAYKVLAQSETGLGKPFDAQFNEVIVNSAVDIVEYTVNENQKISEPLKERFSPQDNTASVAERIIVAKANSESTFIFDYSSANGSGAHDVTAEANNSLFGIRTRVFAEENAIVHLVTVNMLNKTFTHFDSIGSVVSENAKVEVVQIELGAKDVFTGNYENLTGRKAACSGEFGYVANKNNTLDINYVAHQTGKETDSKMNVRGVVMDKAAKIWRGTIDFIRGAKNATGDEQEDVLLLSPDVVNKTLPVILCDEEAVEGRHGASIGKLGKDILFYMQTRGVDEKTAEELMIRAKITSVCHFIPDEKLVEKIENYIEEVFSK